MGGDEEMGPWGSNLKKAFSNYCVDSQKGKHMDGKYFVKFVKDCGLLTEDLPESEVDIMFAKVRDKSQRRITFEQFQNGLALIAKKKGMTMAELTRSVGKSQTPVLHGTRPKSNKFHDDKSLYTGVHINGGPQTVDKDKIANISTLMDRSPTDIRGVKTDMVPQPEVESSGKIQFGRRSNSAAPLPPPCEDSKKLRAVFKKFCATGQKTMDGWEFAKLVRDCDLLTEEFTPTEVDLTFLKCKDQNQKRLTYDRFLVSLALIAQRKGDDSKTVATAVESCQGPELHATKAKFNKFHDDPSMYTGVQAHVHGDPSQLDCERSHNKIILPQPCRDSRQLRDIFKQYQAPNGKGLGMDSAYFSKLTRDVQLLDGDLMSQDVDVVFSRIKTPQEKRITYDQFRVGLAMLAERKGVSPQEVEGAVLKSQGPILKGTYAEPNKFHDDKNLYTGTAVNGGPSTTDHNTVELSKLVERERDASSSSRSLLRNAGMRMMGMKKHGSLRSAAAPDSKELQRVFREYAQGQPGMSGANLLQLARDTQLVDTDLPPRKVEAQFNKAKQASGVMSYEGFLEALAGLAVDKGMHAEALIARVEWAGGPPSVLDGGAGQGGKGAKGAASKMVKGGGGSKKALPPPTPPRRRPPAEEEAGDGEAEEAGGGDALDAFARQRSVHSAQSAREGAGRSPGGEDRVLEKGERVLLRRADGSRTEAVVVGVDLAQQPPSYVIEVDGREHRTERTRLEPVGS